MSKQIECNLRNFSWRKETIVKIRPDDCVGLIGKTVIWNGNEMSWPEFLDEFGLFCDEFDEVPF